MTNDELKTEIDKLRAEVSALTRACSMQFGQNDAVAAALLGVLAAAGGLDRVRQSVETHLERRQAIDLGQSLNQFAVDAFQEFADLARLAMRAASDKPDDGA